MYGGLPQTEERLRPVQRTAKPKSASTGRYIDKSLPLGDVASVDSRCCLLYKRMSCCRASQEQKEDRNQFGRQG